MILATLFASFGALVVKMAIAFLVIVFLAAAAVYAWHNHQDEVRLHGESHSRTFSLESFQPSRLDSSYRVYKTLLGKWEVHNSSNRAVGMIPEDFQQWLDDRHHCTYDVSIEPNGTCTITVYYKAKK